MTLDDFVYVLMVIIYFFFGVVYFALDDEIVLHDQFEAHWIAGRFINWLHKKSPWIVSFSMIIFWPFYAAFHALLVPPSMILGIILAVKESADRAKRKKLQKESVPC